MQTINCPRMHTAVPEDYCGSHPIHCKGCPLLPEGHTVATYQHREWWTRPVTHRGGFEFVERFESIKRHAAYRRRVALG